MSDDTEYRPGLDEIIRSIRPFGILTTPQREIENDTTFAHAEAMKHPLPTGYKVKAIVHCNQLDTFRMIACDFNQKIESRRERIMTLCRRALSTHLIHAHPYLSESERRFLVQRISFNFRDVGR